MKEKYLLHEMTKMNSNVKVSHACGSVVCEEKYLLHEMKKMNSSEKVSHACGSVVCGCVSISCMR